MQINRAIASKKDSFDDDKYMKNERIEHMKETEQRIAEALKNVEVALQVNQC